MTLLTPTREQETFAEELALKHGASAVRAGRFSYVIVEGGAVTVDDVFAVAERFRVYRDGTPVPACGADAECRNCPGVRASEPGARCGACYDKLCDVAADL